jgi:hypothetical protein
VQAEAPASSSVLSTSRAVANGEAKLREKFRNAASKRRRVTVVQVIFLFIGYSGMF